MDFFEREANEVVSALLEKPVDEVMTFLGFSGKMGQRTFGSVLATLNAIVSTNTKDKDKERK